MSRRVSGAILSLLLCCSDLGVIGGRAGRDVACREQQEYRSGSICCQNCPAGTYVAAPCTAAGQPGTCRECDDGTFMEHTNGLRKCFRCTLCRSDQEVVAPCTHTLNTKCRCGPGRFCNPDQACELCKRCSRCGQDEEAVRNCTATANTECKKVQSTSALPAVVSSMALLLVLAIVLAIGLCVWKRRRGTASQRWSAEQKPGQDLHGGEGNSGALGRRWSGLLDARQLVRTCKHTEEERAALRDSCTSSASNSQHSLTGLTSCPSPALRPVAAPPQPPSWVRAPRTPASVPASLSSPLLPVGTRTRRSAPPAEPDPRLNFDLWNRLQELRADEEPFPPLVAVNGEDSLRRCFEFFEELDVDYHRKFFRRLDVSDNVIKGKEELPYEDRIHQLLHVWMEKEGRGASLDQLLQVLLDLNQRRTAENIKERALQQGHYLSPG